MKEISNQKTTPQKGKSTFHQEMLQENARRDNARNKHWVERRQIHFAKNAMIKHVPGFHKVQKQ